ncbi:high mobility group B protein 14-like isoform X2 [Panicum virgatum]|uniref:high mobility group B protein 14-like isoform X2 n=1 Tax=Panicum virgatum TaxID=38727 RepID=UPI0002A9B733|nr:high mobility group B protein 14-like isoform X2 [Panicum virgatum]
MKTRSQTAPKPLKTVALAPRPGSPKRRPRPKPKPKPAGKGDPRAPKKPPTAFFYFMEDFRKTYQQENPSVKLMQEIGKACGEKWNTMAFEEKVKYYDIATEKRAEFEKAMIEYNKKKQSGELSEESDYD